LLPTTTVYIPSGFTAVWSALLVIALFFGVTAEGRAQAPAPNTPRSAANLFGAPVTKTPAPAPPKAQLKPLVTPVKPGGFGQPDAPPSSSKNVAVDFKIEGCVSIAPGVSFSPTRAINGNLTMTSNGPVTVSVPDTPANRTALASLRQRGLWP
jgi:hypothetical protein